MQPILAARSCKRHRPLVPKPHRQAKGKLLDLVLHLVLWQDCCQPATASFSPHFRSVSGEVARNETFCERCGRWKKT